MDAIVNAPDRLAHLVLVALCHDPVIQQRAIDYLRKLEARDATGLSNGTKRKADTLDICSRCGTAFSEEDNSATACSYHEGELEPDYDGDTWADWDSDAGGPIDTDDNRRDYPDGFFWDCCGKHGDEDTTCMQGRHIPASGLKRGRYDEDDGKDGSGPEEASDQNEEQGASSIEEDEEDEDEDEEDE